MQLSEDILKRGVPPKHRERFDLIAFSYSKDPKKRMIWSAALLGNALLDEAGRKYILSMERNAIDRCYQPHNWLYRKELWTQRPYVVTGWSAREASRFSGMDMNTMAYTGLCALII